MKSTRLTYLIAAVMTVLLGLASRRYTVQRTTFGDEILFEGFSIAHFIHNYAGDALWAAMVYFGFRMIFIHCPKKRVAFMAFVFSYAIEFSQLLQYEWLNTIRRTTLGGLILGFGFLWSDLWMYAIGILLAYGIDFYGIKDKD